MLVRCGVAGCILVLFATCLFAWVTNGSDAAHTVLITGSYALLGISGVVFLAGEVIQAVRRVRLGAAPAPRTLEPSPAPEAAVTDEDKIRSVFASADVLVGMLDNTLKLASAVPAGHLEPVDVTDLLGELAGRLKSARLSLTVRPPSLRTLASRPALARALEILVENALSSGRRVSVSCDRGTSALVVHVDDDGPGVPQPDRQRIFEWHTYMSTPPSMLPACRVELVIARQIVRAHGGDIDVGPSPLGGARYTARMPLLHEHEMELAVAS